MKTRKLLAIAPLLALLTACPGNDNQPPPPSEDGGVTETPDAGTPDSGTPDSGPTTVRGSGQWHHIDPSAGIALAPRDLSDITIAALIPDAAGSSYTVKPATLDAAKTAFTIENVTAPYLLRFGTSYSWLTGRTAESFTPDVSLPKFSRRDAVKPGAGTTLVLNVTGLAPWQQYLDELQLASPYAGLRYFPLYCGANFAEPDVGATSINGSIDWVADASSCANELFLIDSSKGDSLYVSQLVGRYASDFQLTIKEIKRAYTTSTFSLKDGQPATLDAALVALPTTTRSLDMRFDDFRTAALAAHPTAVMSALDFGLGALPGWTALGESTGYPDLAVASAYPRTVPNQVLTFEYANPYPAAWGTHLAVRANALTSYSVPLPSGEEAPVLKVSSGVSLSIEMPEAQTGVPVIQPLVGPVRALSVSGQMATGAPLTGVGTTPLVSWQAPEVGMPDFYRVFVYELRVSETTGKTVSRFVADVFTESTSLRLPAELLVSGKYYYLRVQSARSSRWSPVKPFLTQFGEGNALALSSRLMP